MSRQRSVKRNKFGGLKYVYDKETMGELRTFFETRTLPALPGRRASLLYLTGLDLIGTKPQLRVAEAVGPTETYEKSRKRQRKIW